MPRFIPERAPRKERKVVDFEAEAIRAYDAAKADASRYERTGQGDRSAKIMDRARATCIDLFEGAMNAGQPGIAGVIAWFCDLGPTFRAQADAADRALNPRLVSCGK